MAHLANNGRRVVITGMGVVAANGMELDTFWKNILEGNSAGTRLTRFDPGEMPGRAAAEIQDFKPAQFVDDKRARRLDLSTLYAIAAAKKAASDAGIDFSSIDTDRVGVVEGISLGGTEATLDGATAFREKNYRKINAYSLINGYTGGGSGEIALELGIRGHAITYCAGSASGNEAIGYAMNLVRNDDVDLMIAGGTEAPLLAELWAVFSLTKVMTSRSENPQKAMRPFDKSRDGFLLGEGSAFLVLEELTHALQRGAKIYAEIAGHGHACEAFHSVAPHPEGEGMQRAMKKALRSAGATIEEVDYINVHGTATSANDVAETKAIKHVFGRRAYEIAVSSTKPVTGHLLGASGALETVVCALSLHTQLIPLTLNLESPAPDCDLDYVMHKSRPYPSRFVMNLSSGFGGKNACLLLRRYP